MKTGFSRELGEEESSESRYCGIENQLYRMEIHQGGAAWDGAEGNKAKAATFKWSRENEAVIFPIEKLSGIM